MAKNCIPLFCKQTQPLSVAVWLKKVAKINAMDDLVARERGLREKFFKKWFYWLKLIYSEEYAGLLN